MLATALAISLVPTSAANAAVGDIITIAGGGVGDGGQSSEASVSPVGVAVDAAGNIYIADTGNHRVRKIDASTGIITTIAGADTNGYNGDNITATTAQLNFPTGVAVDTAGNIYIADSSNHRIRKVDASTGIITTIAGTDTNGYNGDNITATTAQLNFPTGVAVDTAGNIYIAEYFNYRVRKVDASTGIITTIAGTDTGDYNGDNITATTAQLNGPSSVAVDTAGNIYIADTDNQRVRKIDSSTGIITTIAGTDTGDYNGDNITATTAQLNGPSSVAVDTAGNIYIADAGNQRVRKVDSSTGIITTIAGTDTPGYNGDNITATTAQLNYPYGVAIDTAGNIYIADTGNQRVRKVDSNTGVIIHIAGAGVGDTSPATSSLLKSPRGLAIDTAGNIYIADTNNHRVRKVTASTGLITTIAGTGTNGYNGDNITATTAQLNGPNGVAIDTAGNIYIADTGNERVRKIDAGTGIITTIAGTGMYGHNGDNITATTARLNGPNGVAIDTAGNIYIADTSNHRVRKVTAGTGIITTIAGT
ncbi:MAG: hypothetical protein WCP59_15020, partial [Actinomycetota bacterium]